MGYRHYMYIVPCELVNDIKNMTYEELVEYGKTKGAVEEWDDEMWVDIHEILGRREFHEFGKYYENAENIEALGTPLFANADTQEHFADYNPYVVGRDAVLCAIEDYRNKIIKVYDKLLMSQEEFDESSDPWERGKLTQEERIRHHLQCQKEEWENRWGYTAIDTDADNSRIVRSWLYEYAIFELVHQMKMMDWEKDTLVFYGW